MFHFSLSDLVQKEAILNYYMKSAIRVISFKNGLQDNIICIVDFVKGK